MKYFSTISNLLIQSFFIFIITYLWLSFIVTGFFLTFLLSFMATVVINYLITLIVVKKRKRVALSKTERDHMSQAALSLKFMSQAESLEFLRKLDLDISNHFSFFHKEVTTHDIVDCIRKSGERRAVIIADEFHPHIKTFFSVIDVDVEFIDFEKFYNDFLKTKDVWPSKIIATKSRSKITWIHLRNMIFQKQKARGYVLVGFVILATSFIVTFSIYYIIFATMLFGLALASKLATMP